MRTKKWFYSTIATLLAVILCMSVAGCGEKEETKTTQVPSTAQSADLTSQEQEEEIQYTQDATADVPEQKMCWTCKKVSAYGTSNYCLNCKCMVCDKGRKFGGYLYCSQHNCSVYMCQGMAVDTSQFCAAHKCAMSGCKMQTAPGSQYCVGHKQ